MLLKQFKTGALYQSKKKTEIVGLGVCMASEKKEEKVIIRWMSHSKESKVGTCQILTYDNFLEHFKEYEINPR